LYWITLLVGGLELLFFAAWLHLWRACEVDSNDDAGPTFVGLPLSFWILMMLANVGLVALMLSLGD